MGEKPEKKLNLQEEYTRAKKEGKKYTYNWLKRYGYWAMIVILFTLSIVFSMITIGDVYERNDVSYTDIVKMYEDSGHIISNNDKVIISDIIVEAFSKDKVIDYNEYNKFAERVKSFNYVNSDGVPIRFDVITFYLYTKTNQEFLSFQKMESWRIALVSMNAALALLTTFVFMKTGIQDALNVEDVREKRKELTNKSSIAAKKRLYAEHYFDRLHKNKIESKRRDKLLNNGMKYEVYFDEEGILKKELMVNSQEKKVIQQALAIRAKKLSYDKLVNHSNNESETDKHRDIRQYQMTTGIRSITFKTIIVILFTFVSVSLIVTAQNGWQILLNLVSTIVAFVAGFLEYLNSYSFVVEEYVDTLDAQIRELEAFISWEVPEEVISKIRDKENAIEAEIENVKEEELKEASKMRDDMKAQMVKELENKQKEGENNELV